MHTSTEAHTDAQGRWRSIFTKVLIVIISSQGFLTPSLLYTSLFCLIMNYEHFFFHFRKREQILSVWTISADAFMRTTNLFPKNSLASRLLATRPVENITVVQSPSLWHFAAAA